MSERMGEHLLYRDTMIEENLILLDFDHTLFGANSTELFIAHCQPRSLVAVIDMLVRECIPWRRLGFQRYYRIRDYVCVTLLLLATPWNLRSWKAKAPALWRQYAQAEFDVFLTGACDLAIVSFGMEALIGPLLHESPWRDVRMVATPRHANRRQLTYGKLDLARVKYSDDEIARAAFVTDSQEDADLLKAAARGILIEPLGAPFRSMDRLYLPLRYTMRAKYPFKYFIDQTLLVDIAIAIAATSTSPWSLLNNIPIVVPLYLAFLCVYEIGYYENDFVGAAREEAPTLTAQVQRFRDYPIRRDAWLWAIGLTLCGALAAWRLSPAFAPPPLAVALIWMMVLAVARGVFFLYNRSGIATRLILYPVLQLLKYASIFLVLPAASTVGEALVVGQIIVMSTVYLVYRMAARKPEMNKEIMRMVAVASIVAVEAMGRRGDLVYGSFFATGLPVAWLLLRNLKPILLR